MALLRRVGRWRRSSGCGAPLRPERARRRSSQPPRARAAPAAPSSSRPPAPNRSDTGHGWPKASRVAWMRFFNAVRWRTRCSRQRARSRSARTVGVGSQIAGTRSRRDSSASTQESILSVLQASGASPLTFCASAISTCQPASSSWSCTNRAPFIDSIAAYTGPPNPPIRRPARPTRPGRGRRGHRQRRPRLVHHMHIQPVRLRSNPTCTMTSGLLPTRLAGPAPASVPPGGGPGFMTFIHLRSACVRTTSASGVTPQAETPPNVRRTVVGRPRKRVGCKRPWVQIPPLPPAPPCKTPGLPFTERPAFAVWSRLPSPGCQMRLPTQAAMSGWIVAVTC